MGRGFWAKVALILAVTFGSAWFLVPTYYSFFVLDRADRNNIEALEAKLPKWAPPARYRLSLGLDLQGGIHMVMRVDTKTALQKRTERRGVQIANYLRDQKIGEVTAVSDPETLQITFEAKDAATLDAIQKEITTRFNEFSVAGREGNKLTVRKLDTQADLDRGDAVDQAMLVIRRRIDKWGVAEVDVRKMGTDSIQISLPGQKDPEQAKELIGTTAQLEFRMVDDTSQVLAELYRNSPPPAESNITLTQAYGFPQLEGPSREALLAYVQDKVPNDRSVLLECVQPGPKNTCNRFQTYLVERTAPITGESLAAADVSFDQMTNRPEVIVTFDAQGGRDFAELTEKNVGKLMAIVLDDNVQSAPRINEKIPGGTARITMGRQGKTNEELLKEAQTLALVLKAGALPAPVTIGEIRQVGASLGDELIRRGSLAALVGVALVVLFMAVYYKRAGVIADVALLLNGAMILAGLALFNATLTLPGIAGFVLTLGVAIDANVLINERIREELAAGKTVRAAIDAGYDRAFWAIFDSHVTALIAGFILFSTGTGPIRGFATTLIIGLLASLFTSIFVTRIITTGLVHGRNKQTISI